MRHLEREGLLRTSPLSSDNRAVPLTDRGRDLLEANRHGRHERSWEPRQAFYAGLRKPRELTHDSKVYRAYSRAEDGIREKGGRVDRLVLDYELKRDYQQFLNERNRGRKDSDGRPDREPEEIARWAREAYRSSSGLEPARRRLRKTDADRPVRVTHFWACCAVLAARCKCFVADQQASAGRGYTWKSASVPGAHGRYGSRTSGRERARRGP